MGQPTRSGSGRRGDSSAKSVDDGDRSESPDAAIGRLLRDARQTAGLRQIDVARELGVTQTRIARLELGHRRLLYVEALAFADLYGVSVLAFDPRLGSTASPRRRRIRALVDVGSPQSASEASVRRRVSRR